MHKLARLNTVLLLAIVLINAYVVLAPFAPQVWFWWQQYNSGTSRQLTQRVHMPLSVSSTPAKSEPNMVIIPSMLLDQPIREGTNMYAVLAKGIWRWPQGSTPDKGGNTVLIGHRFTYTNPRGVFYFLNKIQIGDEIGVTWNNKAYAYRVMKTEVVSPSDVSILNKTTQPTLTLYTCTPLWWPTNRLVVIAQMETPS